MAKPSVHKFIDLYYDKVRQLYPNTFLSDENIERILIASENEDQINSLFYFLSKSLKSSPDLKTSGSLLFSHVDSSDYDLSQWIETIHVFKLWLDKEKRISNFDTVLGYISCCTNSPENKMIKFKLVDILNDMIKTHGFNG